MRHHSRTSATEAGRTAFSIWETLDGWHPAAESTAGQPGGEPQFAELAAKTQGVDAGGGEAMHRAGLGRRGAQREPVRGDDGLDVASTWSLIRLSLPARCWPAWARTAAARPG